ncbi:hypothetical protein PISMIDRAFT_199019 [Pisolithus microcarpus 441]|uniref:Uncharacterized protein n=1 Tax=Pisolithus microcarpus 441 TaxID=765257 RepID=A0A0C9YVV4_9AGAM|nr:hypothetical protein PISMIDRAFT_199019 [Pisolithus microcarpus 441]
MNAHTYHHQDGTAGTRKDYFVHLTRVDVPLVHAQKQKVSGYLDSSGSSTVTGKNSMTSSEPTTLNKLRPLGSYANARNASPLAIVNVSSGMSGPT